MCCLSLHETLCHWWWYSFQYLRVAMVLLLFHFFANNVVTFKRLWFNWGSSEMEFLFFWLFCFCRSGIEKNLKKGILLIGILLHLCFKKSTRLMKVWFYLSICYKLIASLFKWNDSPIIPWSWISERVLQFHLHFVSFFF